MIHNVGTTNSLVVTDSTTNSLVRLPPGWFTFAVGNGSGWEFQTSSKNQPFTVSYDGINAKTSNTYAVLTVPPGLKFFTTSVAVETTAISNITTAANVSLGSSANISNIVNVSSLVTNAVNTYQLLTLKTNAAALTSGSVLTFGVNKAAVGTNQTLSVHVSGFYR